MIVISPETRMMGLPCGEEIMIVGRTMWTQSTSVTDGRTDGQTDRITITDTVQRIVSHGKNGTYDTLLLILNDCLSYVLLQMFGELKVSVLLCCNNVIASSTAAVKTMPF